MDYLQVTRALYAEAAITPDDTLCCVSSRPWQLPDLRIPDPMTAMNYGCGTTVHPRDVPTDGSVLYLGVGGGLELLQFASLARRTGAVIGVDPVPEMRAAAERNLALAREQNPWLGADFVEVRAGDALALPIDDGRIGLVAQNCLFNIFRDAELDRALAEAWRVLRPGGALSLSDPICEGEIPEALRDDDRLRAMCLSGAQPLDAYVARLVAAGFGTIEVRARRPYRYLDRKRFPALSRDLLLESVEIVAYKHPVPIDGACVFTGRTAIWVGDAPVFDDGRGHVLRRDVPAPVCDKTAAALAALDRPELVLTAPTWHYDGGGCC